MKHVLYIVLAKSTRNILVDTQKGRKETVQTLIPVCNQEIKHMFPGPKEKTAADSKLNFKPVGFHIDSNF